MKEREVDQRVDDVPEPGRDRDRIDPDTRPPSETESTTRHIFLMRDGVYRCSRCGSEMNDRTLDEDCPAA
jgi:rubrerythrin